MSRLRRAALQPFRRKVAVLQQFNEQPVCAIRYAQVSRSLQQLFAQFVLLRCPLSLCSISICLAAPPL
jgi:hypothetical protein